MGPSENDIRHLRERISMLEAQLRSLQEVRPVSDAAPPQEALEQFFGSSPIPTIVAQEGSVAFVNDAAVRVLKSGSAGALLGRPLSSIVQGEAENLLQECMQQAAQAAGRGMEAGLCCHDGSRVYARLNAWPVRYKGSTAILLTLTDVSEDTAAGATPGESDRRYRMAVEGNEVGVWDLDLTSRMAERSHQHRPESEEVLVTMADAVPSHLWVSDERGQTVFLNRASLDFLGQWVEDVRRDGWIARVHPDDAARFREAQRAADSNRAPYRLKCRLGRHDGVYRWFRIEAVPRLTATGNFLGYAGSGVDITDERLALDSRKQTERQLLLLMEASRVLLASPQSSDMLQAILELARRFIHADAYAVWRTESSEVKREWVATDGLSDSEELLVRLESESRPLYDEPYAVEDVDLCEHLADRRELYCAEGIRSVFTVPLRVHNQLSGVLTLYYRRRHRLQEGEKTIAMALGNLAAAALATAELYDRQRTLRAAAEAAEKRAAFLAEAGQTLASSLDYETTLKSVANLAVPAFADWCAVDILDEEGKVRRLAVKGAESAKVDRAARASKHYPSHDGSVIRTALRTGRSVLLPEMAESFAEELAGDSEHISTIHRLGLRSLIIAPLVVNEQVLGALTFATAESGRRYTSGDLRLAEELARRATTAVENVRLHQNIRMSEVRYRSLVQTMTAIVWTCDVNGFMLNAQPSWESYTGQKQEEYQGLGWIQAVHPDDRERVSRDWQEAVRDHSQFVSYGRLWHAASQSWRHFEVRAVPIRANGGDVREWIGVVQDVHERRVAEEELRRSNRELEEFAYVASHDLQEPLRMVNIYAQLLVRRCLPEDEDAKEFASYINSGVLRMETLIRDLLEYSRTIHEEHHEARWTDLNLSFRQALSLLEARIAETNARITCCQLPDVLADEGQLVQVFQNLLSNALKYRKLNEAPQIEIKAEPRGSHWVIAVADNGIGFDQKYADRIFGLFKRLYREQYPGSGLGLAICKRIVERYGGSIWAESRVGVGSTFYFSLRAANAAQKG